MNEELNEILRFYEEEKQGLEDIIKSYIKEFEYKAAYFHSKRLKKVSQKIQLLKNLSNPYSDKIESLQRMREMYNIVNPILKDNTEYSNYLANQKNNIDIQIENLINQNKGERLDGQEFDDLIFSLVEDRLQNFRFYLNKESNLFLDFKKNNNSLVISIPNYNSLKEDHILRKSSIRLLKGIGMKKDKIEKKLILNFPLYNFKNSIEIKTLTSRIIYDGFGYHNLKNPSIILIIE
ncbi:hypothetical protein [Pedobacter frigiditerrae]|uniref:hypothetical protein n=1 Tax=Pedobacter frigiditerrae TaxID=2530452 RepID=UPI00292CD235|nr:hypothetical protein [Pedobacter frigiditerrae]